LLCAVLAGALGLQFLLPQNSGPLVGTAGRPGVMVERPVALVPVYPAILARPLFTPVRAPGGADAGAGGAGAQLSDFSVVGVALGGRFAAAFVRGAGGEVRTLRPGDSLLGWKVAAVRPDAVVLEVEGRKRELPVAAQAQAQAQTQTLAQPMVALR
jgi:hypothetical protein